MAPNTTRVNVKAVNALGPGGTRCRAGMKFGPDPKEVEVTDEQLKQLKADPVLNVTVPGEAPKAEAQKQAEKTFTSTMSAEDAIKAINACATAEQLAQISTKDEARVTVKDAYTAKRAALK